MSQENVEVVRRVYEATARGDTEAVLACYDPEIQWEFSRSPFRSLVRQDVYHGYDGLRSFIRERFEDAWENIHDELEELIDLGGQVVSVVTSRGRGVASGAEVKRTHAGVWTVQGGKVVRVVWMGSRDEAVEAAGLSE